MNMNEANQLSRIYNTLLLIKTSGEDTILMGKCLETFRTFLQTVEIAEDKIDNNVKEQEG